MHNKQIQLLMATFLLLGLISCQNQVTSLETQIEADLSAIGDQEQPMNVGYRIKVASDGKVQSETYSIESGYLSTSEEHLKLGEGKKPYLEKEPNRLHPKLRAQIDAVKISQGEWRQFDGRPAGSGAMDCAIWWPETRGQEHNDLDLYIESPSGSRTGSTSTPSVFERVQVTNMTTPGTWRAKIYGYDVNTGAQTVYYTCRR